ncbi:hypothetical protein [Ferruginibacter sp.]|nr:hypothetical protein [Ferruginibacter sp.]
MKAQNFKPLNSKKLQLKKIAIAHLTISEDKMKVIMGGVTTDLITTSSDVNVNNCTSSLVVTGVVGTL